ncbi:hypothetical protein [Rubrivirga marina]|uniref:TonB-dependent receptor plug domain-containing protein n=1 Tax=Rubrivirga marina TaxID=1196024 RepID=A0A271IXX4_9BACT|nr:hypothetical protein [Rubrivirga marina]PAP76073.1 hypothetical protein BSZ37_06255 [Rubrivirga marina]
MTALVLAGLLVLTPADSLDARCPSGESVSRAALEAAGATTLHDVLRLTTRFDGVTTDGFDPTPVLGLGVPFAQPARVFVDGAPAARGAGPEPLGLEALPVAVSEVERIVVCPGPGVAGGAFGGPWIDLQTAAPAPMLFGAATYGNESGDPGPFRYLDQALPNVDKIGPDYEAAAVARTPTATAWMALRDRDFLPTDPAIFDRTLPATTRYPKRDGPVLAVAARAGGLRARLGTRWFQDLPFIPDVGREVPLDHTSAQATLSGERTRGALHLWGHGHIARIEVDRPDRSLVALDPSWNETRLDAAFAARLGSPRQSVAAGVQAERAHVTAGPFDGAVAVGRAWVDGRTTFDGGGLAVTLASTAAGGTAGVGLASEGWWRPAARVTLRAEGSARRSLAEERRTLGVWAARGYAGLPPDAPEADPLDVARFQLAARVDRGPGWAEASVEGQRVGGVASGSAGLARLGAGMRLPGLILRADARVQGALTGSAAFCDAWDRLPRFRAALDVTAPLDGRASVWARLDGRSATTWPGGDVARMLLLDLGLSKRAWGDRIHLSLAGRNVLGAEERTHPLGASLEPRLFVRAEARL